MKLSNEIYAKLKMDWDHIGFPLMEGTIVTKSGGVVTDNDKNVFGIVPTTIKERPLLDTIYVLVGGDVDAEEVQGFDVEDDETLAKLSGFNFWYKGECVSSDRIAASSIANQIAPWQDKGRWYHLTFTYRILTQPSFVIIEDQTDQFLIDHITISSGMAGELTLTLPDDKIINDVKFDEIVSFNGTLSANLSNILNPFLKLKNSDNNHIYNIPRSNFSSSVFEADITLSFYLYIK